MGRGVMRVGNAIGEVFLDVSDFDSETWPGFLDDLRGVIRERYPSFRAIDQWKGRETRAILENAFGLVCVSEYGGIACVSFGSMSGTPIGIAWCRRVAAAWERHLRKHFPSTALGLLGTASNGEQFFQRTA